MASRAGRRGKLVESSERNEFLEKLERHDDSESLSSSVSNDGENGAAAASPVRPRSKRSVAVKKRKLSSETQKKKKGKDKDPEASNSAAASQSVVLQEEGCLVCKRNDDLGNLMICEGCHSEYHYYCLDHPLRSVPRGDWFCDQCNPVLAFPDNDDGLDRLVLALSPRFTERFGEVLWAQGGSGFGWWPAAVYDPRLTTGGARELAFKHLGRKHLVYYFECHTAPFAVLAESKLMAWESGLAEDCHLGKTASSAGNARTNQFRAAFQVAILELGKPIEMRLEWNHQGQQEEHLASPDKFPTPRPDRKEETKKRKRKKGDEGNGTKRKRSHASEEEGSLQTASPASRRNLLGALHNQALAANKIDATESKVYCKILKRLEGRDVNVGFVRLDSHEGTTFADARVAVEDELDDDSLPSNSKWKFYVPSLGPISRKQEGSLGAMIPFLQSTCGECLGEGSVQLPLQLFIIE